MFTGMTSIIVALDVVMAVTLPLHCRIMYVLIAKYRKINLDPSFHTLMINACAINIAFSLIYIFIQEPASSGIFFEFYKSIGGGLAKVVQIQSTCLITLGAVLHLFLGLSRLTAIAFPLSHVSIWTPRRLLFLYIALWTLFVLACIPLLLPGSTAPVVNTNVYGTVGLEFALLGFYYQLYAVYSTGFTTTVEFVTFLCYIGMCLKFRSFLKTRVGSSSGVKKITRGVMKTTLAAFLISMGSWLLVAFFVIVFGNIYSTGRSPFTKLEFSVLLRLLNVLNNIVTAWVLVTTFSKVRRAVIGFELPSSTGPGSGVPSSQPRNTTTTTSQLNRGRF